MINNRKLLIQQLPEGPLDIIGDIHGEYKALKDLLIHLGYDGLNKHPQSRKLVFIGDFCDRGQNSPAVIFLVQKLIKQGIAVAILGNHEINLLNNDPKDGSGWFFEERFKSDLNFYAPFKTVKSTDKHVIINFLNTLPLALERTDLRIVHATWDQNAINEISNLKTGKIKELGIKYSKTIKNHAENSGLLQRYKNDIKNWKHQLEDFNNPPPFLDSIAEYDELERLHNPIKVLTSGIEAKSDESFYSGNRWRYSDRLPWWEMYTDTKPVVIGHYWRLHDLSLHKNLSRYSKLFTNINPIAWHGALNNVFCVDYSVGARWRDRKNYGKFKLAALRWPERHLVFDSGEESETIFFMNK